MCFCHDMTSYADLLCKKHKGWQVCSSVFTRCSDLLVSHQRNGEEKVSANQSWLGSDPVSQFIPGRMIPTLHVIFIAWIQQQKLQLCCIEGLSRHVVVCFILLFHPVIFLNKGIPEESSLLLPPSRCRHVPHCWRWRSRWMVGLVGWMLGWMDEWMDGDGATCEISVFELWRPSFGDYWQKGVWVVGPPEQIHCTLGKILQVYLPHCTLKNENHFPLFFSLIRNQNCRGDKPSRRCSRINISLKPHFGLI